MVASLKAAEKVLAATYAHNQNYYDQADRRAADSRRFERHAGNSPYRKAAASLAGLVRAAADVKQAAFGLRRLVRAAGEEAAGAGGSSTREAELEQPGTAATVRQLKRLIDAYNTLQERISAADGYLGQTAAMRRFIPAASGFADIGIASESADVMGLDEQQFARAWNARFEQTANAVTGAFGLTERMTRIAEQFDETPPYSLLNTRSPSLRAFAVYRPDSGLGMQLSTAGMLFDATF